MAGRSFQPLHRATVTIDSGGLPLVDVPDLKVGSMEAAAGPWEVPDPVNPQIATTVQVAAIGSPVRKAAPVADALWIAGQTRRRRLTGRRYSGVTMFFTGLVRTSTESSARTCFAALMDPASSGSTSRSSALRPTVGGFRFPDASPG